MRYTKEVRFRFFGDEDAGQEYIPLARNLLGQAVRIGELGGLQQNEIRREIEGGVEIRARMRPWGMEADIYVPTGEQQFFPGRWPALGTGGLLTRDGVTSMQDVASYSYIEPYFSTPLSEGVYLGTYESFKWVDVQADADNFETGSYPDPTDPNESLDFSWHIDKVSDTFVSFTPFTAQRKKAVDEFLYTQTNPVHKGAFRYFEIPTFVPLRTAENGDKIGFVLLQIRDQNNVDAGGIAQAVPAYIFYNMTTHTILSSATIVPLPGKTGQIKDTKKSYSLPRGVGVGDTNFYIFTNSYSGYITEYDAFSYEDRAYEVQVLYTPDDGASFTAFDLRPEVENYLNTADEVGTPTPADLWESDLTVWLNLLTRRQAWVALEDNQALLVVLPFKEINFETHVTELIFLCTPNSVTLQHVRTGKRSQVSVIKSWVYLGLGVVLAKASLANNAVGNNVFYRVSNDYGATWVDVPAFGLPAPAENQYRGSFAVLKAFDPEDTNQESVVLTTAWNNGAYRSYVTRDVGQTWQVVGELAQSEQFHRVDETNREDGSGNFDLIRYYGPIDNPAPFNPAVPELMRRPPSTEEEP